MNGATPSKFKPILIAGAGLGIASVLPIVGCLNFCCCALAIGGGFLASFLYLRAAPRTPDAPYGDGALLGLGAGATGAVVSTALGIPMRLLQSALGLDRLMLNILEGVVEKLPPEAAEAMRTSIEQSMSTEFQVNALLTGFAFSLVLFSIFALLGSIIGVAVLHKKQLGTGPMAGSAPPPPPPATL